MAVGRTAGRPYLAEHLLPHHGNTLAMSLGEKLAKWPSIQQQQFSGLPGQEIPDQAGWFPSARPFISLCLYPQSVSRLQASQSIHADIPHIRLDRYAIMMNTVVTAFTGARAGGCPPSNHYGFSAAGEIIQVLILAQRRW